MNRFAPGFLALVITSTAHAQGSVPAAPQPQGQTAQKPPTTPSPSSAPPQNEPLKLYSLGSETQADPFPPVNPKYFTADSPSVATVEGYLKTMLGFDPNRIWRVMAIQKTAAPGVSKVTALISVRSPNAKVESAVFFVLPDGKHLIASDASGVSPFGVAPFAENRALIQARADGPAHNSASKDLMLVEFADLQCPHCKDAQETMNRLVQDFPKARIVFENYPLTEIHPFAYEAATYGVCVAKQGADAFFTYAQNVYDNQAALVPATAEVTLKNAAAKAGADPAAVAACSTTEAAKAQVEASTKLATDLGINSTPVLSVNGRLVPIAGVSYATLKALIIYQAGLDGSGDSAASPSGSGIDLKTPPQ